MNKLRIQIFIFVLLSFLVEHSLSADDTTELLEALDRAINFEGEHNGDWKPFTYAFEYGEMVLVPVGSFHMGSTTDEIEIAIQLCNEAKQDDDECEFSQFSLEVSNEDNTQIFNQPFWIDKTEVTHSQYQQCVDAGECEDTPDNNFSLEPNQPINNVTWFQSQTYCEWRDARLPTEAEWEYAARGPDGFIFPWGNDFDDTLANHCDSQCAITGWASNYTHLNPTHNDGYTYTAPVGRFIDGASWVGGLDLGGNVLEWTSTLYADYPYSTGDGREDTTGERADFLRVLRGGSFRTASYWLRSAHRASFNPSFYIDSVGFRCVMPISIQE